ncbi:glycosyltransferase family 2 protein [Stieleria bergensis]
MKSNLRSLAGLIVREAPHWLPLLMRADAWWQVRNHTDSVTCRVNPSSMQVESDQTSSLRVADRFPWAGRYLFRKALKQWSFQSSSCVSFSDTPTISFIIPFRGQDRLPQLLAVIRSIAALPGDVECIVVEQGRETVIEQLPGNTRYLRVGDGGSALDAQPDDQWNKCYAINQAAQVALGKILVPHDADVLVPSRYAEVICDHLISRGQQVIYPQRFLFYLNQLDTGTLLQADAFQELAQFYPLMVKQNWTGGTLAITRDAFDQIGGYDETFRGWNGEDYEFYDRCQLLDGWFHGYVPFVHLWHPPQPGRLNPVARKQVREFTDDKLRLSRRERVRGLVRPRKRGLQSLQGGKH